MLTFDASKAPGRDTHDHGQSGLPDTFKALVLYEKSPGAVTGATGGVGSVAVAILAQLGYRVVASTGRPEMHDYLKSLGAAEIINREELAQTSDRPLESERWAGAIDSVGGSTLPRLLSQTRRFGSVAACGLWPEASFTRHSSLSCSGA